MQGKVYLIGAGPGDPGLITIKGRDCIAKAHVVIYDYLASSLLLAHATPNAELIYVGKKGGDHTLSQEGINALIVSKAREGKIVARLKGGDPFIFGRGGEEAQALIAAGLPFEIVPGVTSAIAAPAYAGIPLTHRQYTSTVAFVTGHEDPNKNESSIDWQALARGVGTLVFLMGVKNLPRITRQLIQNGMPPEKPVALVRWGTTPRQVTVTGTLADIVERAEKAGLKAPAIIIVGDVVTLRTQMAWFEKRPLMGKRIVVTRAREQASELVAQLTELGAECLEFPTIKIAPPEDWTPLDQALDALALYDWLIFTSVNGVDAFFQRLFARQKDVRVLGHVRTAAIGPATAARLLRFGLNSDIIPDSYRAEAVVTAFEKEAVAGCRVLLPRAREARSVLPVELTGMGAEVTEIAVYRTLPVAENGERLLQLLADGQVDLVTFTSSSTVRNFNALIPEDRRQELLRNVTLASIGPITSQTAAELGFTVAFTAETYTVPGLCQAIVAYYQSRSASVTPG
jgi:uroporphyrinogen III methyltransferase/synthase